MKKVEKLKLPVADPIVRPVNGRILCIAVHTEEDRKTKSNLILPRNLYIDNQNKLTKKAPDVFVAISIAPEVKTQYRADNGDPVDIQQGDVIIPITSLEYQSKDDGSGKRVEVYVYPSIKDADGNTYYYIDQYEVLSVDPDKYDVEILSKDDYQAQYLKK